MAARTTPHKFKKGDKVLLLLGKGSQINYGKSILSSPPHGQLVIKELTNHSCLGNSFDYRVEGEDGVCHFVDEVGLAPYGELSEAIYE